jgi:hypothetical protein
MLRYFLRIKQNNISYLPVTRSFTSHAHLVRCGYDSEHFPSCASAHLCRIGEGPTGCSPEPLPGSILLVEDDPLVRFPIAEALRDLGISVVEAATADEAWEHLRVAASTVDLVFTDYNMPG